MEITFECPRCGAINHVPWDGAQEGCTVVGGSTGGPPTQPSPSRGEGLMIPPSPLVGEGRGGGAAPSEATMPSSRDGAAAVRCRSCGAARELYPNAVEGGCLRACPVCATEDFYVQKDFPQGLGLLIVVAGFAVATVFWYYEMPVPTYLVLLASALLDMVLYYRVPNVTICYRCLSQFRGAGANPGNRFGPFDLAVGERYRQERLRVEQLRERRASADSPPCPEPGRRM